MAICFVSMLGSSIVGLIKSQSAHACPWNMVHPNTLGSYIWDFSAKHGIVFQAVMQVQVLFNDRLFCLSS